MPQDAPPKEDMYQLTGKDYNDTSIYYRVSSITTLNPLIPHEAAYAAVTDVKTSFDNDYIEAAAIAIAANRLEVKPNTTEAKATALYYRHNPLSNEGVRLGLKDSALENARALLVKAGVKNPQQADLDQIMAKATELAQSAIRAR